MHSCLYADMSCLLHTFLVGFRPRRCPDNEGLDATARLLQVICVFRAEGGRFDCVRTGEIRATRLYPKWGSFVSTVSLSFSDSRCA